VVKKYIKTLSGAKAIRKNEMTALMSV
jgi:hypothetical protein